MNRERVYINEKFDRENLCLILVRNGYVVKIGSEKNGSSTKLKYYVEYYKE
ncbi:MAG: resolvase [Clostridia bacterium]|nr:resolvase [Clostridia bacterium]